MGIRTSRSLEFAGRLARPRRRAVLGSRHAPEHIWRPWRGRQSNIERRVRASRDDSQPRRACARRRGGKPPHRRRLPRGAGLRQARQLHRFGGKDGLRLDGVRDARRALRGSCDRRDRQPCGVPARAAHLGSAIPGGSGGRGRLHRRSLKDRHRGHPRNPRPRAAQDR